ncbi:MAG: FtsX-like permease family protein [Elusimicrobiota bacterium]
MTLFKRLYLRHWPRLLFFSSCIALGVAFLFGTGNLLAAVDRAVGARARELLSADVEVASNRPFGPAAREMFELLESEGVRIGKVVSFSSMLRPEREGTAPFLVSVKAIDGAYPLYGDLVVDPPGARAALTRAGACLLDEAGALQHGLSPGDTVRLGAVRLRVSGLIKAEPDRTLARFALAPRLIISQSQVEETGLVRFGSRIRHQRLLALARSPDPAAAARRLSARLEERLDDPYLRITAYPDSEPRVRRVLRRLTGFFALVSIVVLLLGAVGMAASIALFLDGQTETAAILRCLGLGPRAVARLYHGLCLAVGLQGGALGVAGGWLLSAAAIRIVTGYFSLRLPVEAVFDKSSLAEAFLVACVLSVGVPFAKVRALSRLSPLDILRERRRGIPPTPWAFGIVIALAAGGVFLYSFLRSDSWELAGGFSAGLIGAGAAVSMLTWAALKGADVFATKLRAAPFAVRHGMLQLARRRARSLVFLFTLSAGFSLLGALDLVRTSLGREILLGKAEDLPDLFMVDVQPRQLDGVRELARRFGRGSAEFAPLIRARLTHISGKSIRDQDLKGLIVEKRSRRRFLTREYNLTYKDRMHKSEEVVSGRFWDPEESTPQISLERGFSERTGIGMGDVLRFDIQGRFIEAPVTSIRKIEWISMRPNFFIVFTPAILEKAPRNFVGSLRIRDPERIAAFTAELGRRFSNVSVIDITKAFDNISSVLETLLEALKAVAWFCVAVGLLVLAGTLGLDHKERRSQAALFRAMGCGRGLVVMTDAVELIVTGLLTFAIGGAVAYGLGWFISLRLELRFASDSATVVRTLAAAIVLPLAVGLAVNARAYGASVLETLRREA